MITELEVDPDVLAFTRRGAAARSGSTTFRYVLSEDAVVHYTIKRRSKQAGKLVQEGRAGRNERRFSGIVKAFPDNPQPRRPDTLKARRKLRPGNYLTTLEAIDRGGNRSQPARVRFRVVRR